MTKKEYEIRYNRLKSTGLYTEEEIQQLIIDDEKVDKGEPLPWDLTPEQKKNQKKALSTGTRVQKTPTKKEKKVNPTKQEVINLMFEVLNQKYENVNITNAERMIAFSINELNFEITLTQKREKK